MAVLRSEAYTLEMNCRWEDLEGVTYDLVFKWQGSPIINEEVLKRVNEYWSRGPRNGFFLTEYAGRRPLPFLRKMLDAVEPDDDESIEPEVQITVWPLHAEPVDRSAVLYESERARKEREELEARKKELGKLPDDLFQVEFFVDTYYFKDAWAPSLDGIKFVFLVQRSDLERFVEELEREREAIVSKYADNPEGHGRADMSNSLGQRNQP